MNKATQKNSPLRHPATRLACMGLAVMLFTLTPGLVPQAEAGYYGDWAFGAGFKLGGFHFNIGFHKPRYHSHGDYYYRARAPFRYSDHSCSRACYIDRGHHYHHRSCPALRHHLDRHGYEHHKVTERYFPSGYRYGSSHHRDQGGDRYYDRGYDRNYKYDKYERRDRYNDRYDDDRYDDDYRYKRRPRRSCPYGG